jgi:hypothetical protein
MFERHVEHLKSVESARRREAIEALAESGDPRALGPLVQTAKNDPDRDLRNLANSAAEQLREQQSQAGGTVIQPLTASPATPKHAASEGDKRKAREYLNRALSHRLNAENKDAIAELAKALKLDPALQTDAGAVHLASDLTGASSKLAVAAVIQKDHDLEILTHRTRLGRPAWVFMLELVLLFPVLVAVFALSGGSLIQALGKLTEITLPAVFTAFQSSISTLQPSDLSTALGAALFLFVTLLFADGIMYAMGMSRGGVASSVRFLGAMLAVQTILIVLIALLHAFIVVPVLSTPASRSSNAYSAAWVTTGVGGIILAGLVAGQSYVAGIAHRFGFVRGWLSVMIGSIAFAGLWIVIGLLTIQH